MPPSPPQDVRQPGRVVEPDRGTDGGAVAKPATDEGAETLPGFGARVRAAFVSSRVLFSASAGSLLGACAGLVTALGDYGATWLWLPLWGDRLSLLHRLLAFQVPIGAIAGLVLGAVNGSVQPILDPIAQRLGGTDLRSLRCWHARLSAAMYTVILSPLVVWVAFRLFTGGKMSQLTHRRPLELLTAGILLPVCWFSIQAALRLHDLASRLPSRRARWFAIGLLLPVFACGKIDQLVLPNHYGYLHAVLSLACWAGSYLVFSIAFHHLPAARRLVGRAPYAGVALAAVLCAVLYHNVVTLHRNQNARVALYDPRASHSRSLLLSLRPLLATAAPRVSGIRRAKVADDVRTSSRYRSVLSSARLPCLPDAHLLLVTIDALRADHVSGYGYRRVTSPHLDQLAGEATLFERAYVQAPHSSFSISSLMTSQYLHETVDLGQPLPQQTLASVLSKAGYYTAGFFTLGIFHTAGDRLELFRRNAYRFALHDHANRGAEAMTNRALEEVDRIIAIGEPNSFFWVHYFDVHEPYQATTFGTSDADRYDSEILKTDAAVGRLVAEARKRFTRDLVVLVTADHGEEFRDHGGVYHGSTLYDEQTRVPLIIHIPGLPARRIASPVELNDVAPTVLALLGVPVPESMRGVDLRPLLNGEIEDRGAVFSAVMQKRMVVKWPYKLIADLRFGLYELFDLSVDSHERINLADQKPALLESLRGEIYAWLDSLSDETPREENALLASLHRGRLGDRRAVKPLSRLILDRNAPLDLRVEAARIIGTLADKRAAESLIEAMEDDEATVAAEAAIALGRMYDVRARNALRALVSSEDPVVRVRAGVSLGRLRDAEAVPALIDALWIAPTKYEREEAIRWLGRLRDGRALDALIRLLPESRTRYLIVIAMGQIGDARAFDPLIDVLTWDRHTNVRDNVIRGLGLLGDGRAVEPVLRRALAEPTLKNTGESLVRLGAIASGAVGGADLLRGRRGLRGFRRCHAGPEQHDWNYLHRTWCESARSRASLSISIPESVANADRGAVAILAARRTDEPGPVALRLTIGRQKLDPVEIDGQWSERRWSIPPGVLARGSATARIRADRGTRFALDHLLLIPRPSKTGIVGPDSMDRVAPEEAKRAF
jgi:HEAT repeat protein